MVADSCETTTCICSARPSRISAAYDLIEDLMTFSNRQRLLGWAILLACLIAIPVGIFSRSNTKEQNKQASTEGELSAFMPKQDRIVVMPLSGMIYEEEPSFSLLSSRYTPTYI